MQIKRVWCVGILGLMLCSLLACTPTDDQASKIPITTSSDEARDAYLKGRQLLEELRITDAREYFAAAAEADPLFALAHLGMANTSATNTEFFDALERAKQTKITASAGEQMLISAVEAAVNNQPSEQRAQLEALVEEYPDDERAHNALAIYLFGQQDYVLSINEYRAAIEIDPEFTPPYNQLGYALRTIGDYEGAEETFQRYTELISDQPNPYDSYAELLMKMGRFEESIAKYEKALEIDPNFFNSYVGIGNNFLFMGQTEEARKAFSKIETIARTDAERRQACTWRAIAYIYDKKDDLALSEAKKRYEIATETDDRNAMAGDLNFMGTIHLMAGRTEEALEKYNAQLEMVESADVPDEVKEAARRNHLFNKGRAELWAGDIVGATKTAKDYSEAVAVHKVRFEVQLSHELNALIEIANGNYNPALYELEQANQQNPRVMYLQAKAHKSLGNDDEAREALRRVIDFNQLNGALAWERPKAQAMLKEM